MWELVFSVDLDLPIGSVRPPLLNIELRDLDPAESDSGPVSNGWPGTRLAVCPSGG